MLDGSDLVTEYPATEVLLENLEQLQEVFNCWVPRLQKVNIKCGGYAPCAPPSPRVGSFFSGGVDSNYTLLRRKEDIDDLIVISGFDFDMGEDTFATVLNRLSPIAGAFGKRLLPMRSNFIVFEKACGLHRHLSFGSALAAHAIALGYRKVYIPASLTYRQLDAWGSHPLTDPLWSNGCTKLVHDGADARRIDKIRAISQEPQLMNNLIVCWNDPNGNCGTCDKCLRTRTALRVLGITLPTFEPLTSMKPLKQLDPHTPAEVEFLFENLEYARKNKDDAVVVALTAILRRGEFRQSLIGIDDTVLRGTVRRIFRKLHRPDPPPERLTFEHHKRRITELS
jgi:hypothetical protein